MCVPFRINKLGKSMTWNKLWSSLLFFLLNIDLKYILINTQAHNSFIKGREKKVYNAIKTLYVNNEYEKKKKKKKES